jgi:hypothetical protein
MGPRGPTELHLGIVPRAIAPRAAITVRSPRIGAILGPLTEATRPHRRTGAIPLPLLRAAIQLLLPHVAIRGGLTPLRHRTAPRVIAAAVTLVPIAAVVDTPPAEVVVDTREAEGDSFVSPV